MNSDQQAQAPQFVPPLAQQQAVQGSSQKQSGSPAAANEEVGQIALLGYN